MLFNPLQWSFFFGGASTLITFLIMNKFVEVNKHEKTYGKRTFEKSTRSKSKGKSKGTFE